MASKDFVFKMITNRKGRPITVFLAQAEPPNAKESEGYYVDPVDGAKVEIELGGSWLTGNGATPRDAYEVRLKKK